jgi:hypothetical protein
VTKHWDRNKERCFALAQLVAEKILQNPALIAEGRRYLDRHVRGKSAQQPYYDLWVKVLELAPEEIASRLVADTPEGALLRDTCPVFYVPSNAERSVALGRRTAHT